MGTGTLHLHLRSQILTQDAGGHNEWREVLVEKRVPVSQAALLLCDVWDNHWSRGAAERVDAMVPKMNDVVKAAREAGVQIVHAPSDTLDFYVEAPARRRVLDVPSVDPPEPLERDDPPLPVDASGGGSDTGETETHKAWSRQHAGIEIDQERDVISDRGAEVYSFLRHREIDHVLIMGVHTNMCVLNRSFAIKQMVRWGQNVALIRDLTDAMYNPAKPPYVSHAEGTNLIIEYIEKFWCPTLLSDDLL